MAAGAPQTCRSSPAPLSRGASVRGRGHTRRCDRRRPWRLGVRFLSGSPPERPGTAVPSNHLSGTAWTCEEPARRIAHRPGSSASATPGPASTLPSALNARAPGCRRPRWDPVHPPPDAAHGFRGSHGPRSGCQEEVKDQLGGRRRIEHTGWGCNPRNAGHRLFGTGFSTSSASIITIAGCHGRRWKCVRPPLFGTAGGPPGSHGPRAASAEGVGEPLMERRRIRARGRCRTANRPGLSHAPSAPMPER